VVWAGLDVILEPFPYLGDGFHVILLEVWKFSPQGIGFAHGEKLREKRRGILRTDSFLLFVEPLFRLPRKGEGKQTEPDASLCDVFDDYGVAQLQLVLQVLTVVRLHHRDQASA
jgi:hypothetical protein